MPKFDVVHSGRRVRRSKPLSFPLIVKSLTEEASVGIAQASVVWDDAELDARVKFIHESITGDALIEEFIDGREIYVGVLGNKRLTVLPPWELFFENTAPGAMAIATQRVKHNLAYQKKHGITEGEADIDPAVRAQARCRWRSGSTATSRSTATRGSTSGCAPTGRRSSSRRTRIPRSRARRSSRSRRSRRGSSYEKLIETILALGVRRGTM